MIRTYHNASEILQLQLDTYTSTSGVNYKSSLNIIRNELSKIGISEVDFQIIAVDSGFVVVVVVVVVVVKWRYKILNTELPLNRATG